MLELIEAKNIDELMFFIAVRACIILVCWFFMFVSSIVDFWSGTTTAKALGQTLISNGFRRTIIKIGDYVKIMLFALMFDILGSLLSFYIVPFATILCTIAIIYIEGKSVVENSKRKKANAGKVPHIIEQIIQATTAEQSADILKKISQLLALSEK